MQLSHPQIRTSYPIQITPNKKLGDAIGIITGIATSVAALGTAGVSAYGLISSLEMAKKRESLEKTITQTRLKMEQDLAAVQTRIMTDQAELIKEKSKIDLDLQKSTNELLKLKLARETVNTEVDIEIDKIYNQQRLEQAQRQATTNFVINNTNANTGQVAINQPEEDSSLEIVVGIVVLATGALIYKKMKG